MKNQTNPDIVNSVRTAVDVYSQRRERMKTYLIRTGLPVHNEEELFEAIKTVANYYYENVVNPDRKEE